MTDKEELLQKIAGVRTDHQDFQPNIHLNDQESGYLKEILLSEMQQNDASYGYKAIMITIIQKLNAIN